MCLQKRHTLKKYITTSQFNHCPLIWMTQNRYLNNKINLIHERALRVVYSGDNSEFEELLIKNKSVKNHPRNIQQLGIKIVKTKIGLSPLITYGIFNFTEN